MIAGLFAGRHEKLIFEPGRHLVGDEIALTVIESHEDVAERTRSRGR